MAKRKASKNKGLGKGLSSLLGDSAVVDSLRESTPGAAAAGGGQSTIAIERIHPGPWQPRSRFDEAGLKELAASIRQHGVVQPLLVRPKPGKSGEVELIAGERRWRAAQIAGVHELPVLVRDADDRVAAEISLIENIQRFDLDAVEEAAGYNRLMEEFGYTQEKLAKIVGKSRSHLANTLRLLNLPKEVKGMIGEGKLSAGQARPLVGRADAAKLARKVAAQGMSVRQVEAMVRKADKPAAAKPKADSNLAALEKELREALGVAVDLSFNPLSERGSITLKARTLDQFDGLVAKLKS